MTEFYTHCGIERYFDFDDKVCDEETGKALTVKEIVDVLNDLEEKSRENGKIASKYLEENEQLKQRCKELRNDLIDHSALINMLEDVKSLRIEDMIWNTMGYKTQTEFDDDFADYREDAKRKWRE